MASDACGDGKYRRVLASGLQSAGRRLRIVVGECAPCQAGTGSEDRCEGRRVVGRSAQAWFVAGELCAEQVATATAGLDSLSHEVGATTRPGDQSAAKGAGRCQHQIEFGSDRCVGCFGTRHAGGVDCGRDGWCAVGAVGPWPSEAQGSSAGKSVDGLHE